MTLFPFLVFLIPHAQVCVGVPTDSLCPSRPSPPLPPPHSLASLSGQFFEHAEHIFNACDMEGKGLVDREVFFSIVRQMNQTPSDIQHEHEVWCVVVCARMLVFA